MESTAPNCHRCESFQVTYDSKAPKGCSRFGFKTRNLPSLDVLVNTGKQCVFFVAKAPEGNWLPVASCSPVLPEGCSLSVLA